MFKVRRSVSLFSQFNKSKLRRSNKCFYVAFSPDKHLFPWKEFKENGYTLDNVRRYKLSELGLDCNKLNSVNYKNYIDVDFAFNEPIRILSNEAIDIIHDEMNKEIVLKNCYYQHINNKEQILVRGIYSYSSFMNELINSMELTKLLSYLAGIELDLYSAEMERGNIVIQRANDKNNNVLSWHFDSQPFTLIIMISDPYLSKTDDKNNGGTLYKDGEGNIVEIVYPESGYGAIINASKIEHCSNFSNEYIRAVIASSYKKKDTMDCGNLHYASQYSPFKPLLTDYINARFNDLQYKMENIKNNINYMNYNYNHLLNEVDDMNQLIEAIKENVNFIQTKEDNNQIPKQIIVQQPIIYRKNN